jgi:pyridoxamine 5'-phosphate oxidase-like protein
MYHQGERTNRQRNLGSIARTIIDSNAYMTLATADGDGRPWASPVWYAAAGYAEFYWVSSPEARHSRNLAARPEVSIVIFDSRVPIGTGQAVYVSAIVEELTGADLDRGIVIFSGRSEGHGASEWKPEDVRPPALHRLYRAIASEHWVLDPGGHPVHGRAVNYRTPVTIEASHPEP